LFCRDQQSARHLLLLGGRFVSHLVRLGLRGACRLSWDLVLGLIQNVFVGLQGLLGRLGLQIPTLFPLSKATGVSGADAAIVADS
jgi:hypothetical protein